ncbi:MAG: hypothetical protein WAT28_14585, partial [Sphingorhabdus sp.]
MNSTQPSSQKLLVASEDGSEAIMRRWQLAGLGAALLLSLLLLWFATGNIILVGAALAALVGLAAIVDYWNRARAGDTIETEVAPPDWTVMRAIADLESAGVAITDRAGRLLCANDRYIEWFDGTRPPPDMGLDEGSHDLLLKAGRA